MNVCFRGVLSFALPGSGLSLPSGHVTRDRYRLLVHDMRDTIFGLKLILV